MALNNITKATDLLITLNEIQLEDNALGWYDEPVIFEFLSVKKSLSFYKPYGSDPYTAKFNFTDPLIYWNFYMDNKVIIAERKRFTIMEVLSEIGGVYTCIGTTLVYLSGIFLYRRHETKLLEDYLTLKNIYNKKEQTVEYWKPSWLLSIKFWFY